MTRWARGGTANTKKPHEATPWDQMQTDQSNGKSNLQKKERLASKKKQEKDDKSNKNKVLPSKEVKSEQSKSFSDDSSDSESDDNMEINMQTNTSGPCGLAAELEALGSKKGVEEQFVKSDTYSVKSKAKKTKKKSKQDKLKLDIGIKAQKLLKTELTENLSKVKKSLSLSVEEQTELQDIIKKDQRREKRRLKRIDKKSEGKMCFNCRKKGHTLSDCPEARSQGSGICFKCGSTEHNVAQCRLKLPEGRFPYAKCFICGEQGHMSKQCPDNPRGLYPNGGCCRTCSSVEHYNKDCPLLQQQQGIGDYKLTTLTSTKASADEELSLLERQLHKPKHKKAKVVKF